MLPLLRIIPIGGVGAAVLILVLALTPPREPRNGVSPEMVLARGPLIDRNEHPEWPQFLIQTAFRRAGELLKLRDLPDTPTLTEPIVLPRQRPVIAAVPPPPAPPPDSGVESAAKALDVARRDDPATAPATTDIVKAPVPDTAAAPVPPPAPPAPEMKVAVLPQERPAVEPDRDVTGSIGAGSDATIPVDIGEMSSNELPIVLPRERPPILRVMERERSSHLAPHKRKPRRIRTAAKPANPANVQPASEINLFEALFDNSKTSQRAAAAPAAKRGKAASADNPSYPPVVTYPFNAK
ncbi:MAG TPA: hypothetical protein VN655_13300 [Pseudolabrys sp.]|jgi:hypothetical protein|nr:hypothetical protein [Pseudolabrys sp.]